MKVCFLRRFEDGLQSIASFFRAQIFKTLEPGTYVEVDESCPSLQGRLGKVLTTCELKADHLLEVQGLKEPKRVDFTALKFYPRYVQKLGFHMFYCIGVRSYIRCYIDL